MPAVLIEVAYINNDKDRAKLKDPKFQRKVAEAIVAGLRAYVEGEGEAQLVQKAAEIRPAASKDEDERIQTPEQL